MLLLILPVYADRIDTTVRHFVYDAPTEFGSDTQQAWDTLEARLQIDPNTNIYIDMDGVGGDTFRMLDFINVIRTVQHKGHYVTFIVREVAGSAHALALIVANARLIEDKAFVYYHCEYYLSSHNIRVHTKPEDQPELNKLYAIAIADGLLTFQNVCDIQYKHLAVEIERVGDKFISSTFEEYPKFGLPQMAAIVP